MSQPTKENKPHTLVFSTLQSEQIIDGKVYLLVPKNQLQALVDQLKEQKADIQELKNVVIAVLKLMGLYDEATGTIKESVRSGEEGYFKYIIKALKDVLWLMLQAKASKEAEKELAEKFAFIKTLLTIIPKYAGE